MVCEAVCDVVATDKGEVMKGTMFLCACIIASSIWKHAGFETDEEASQTIVNICFMLWGCDLIGWLVKKK